jgi:hypothetical protein
MAITLTEVETAITAIQTNGQSFTLGDMSYSGANLSALISLRDKLLNESARASAGRPLFRAFGFRSMGYSSTGTDTTPTPVVGVTP